MSVHAIRYLKRSVLDTVRWDECIDRSPNGLVYGYSFYLDAVAKHWDALVMGDYEAVMPLTWNKKWGFRYLYQPPFTQQLGIFSPKEISSSLITNFLEKLTLRFRFGEIFLNHGNGYPAFTRHSNFIISLDTSYGNLCLNYKGDAVRNLGRSRRFGLSYTTHTDLLTALNAYRCEYGERIPHLKNSDYRRFERLCGIAQQNNELIVRTVLNSDNNILAVSVLLQKNKRLYLIQSTTFAAGRKVEANYYLIDQIIEEFAGKGFLLDFEGSDIPGIAHFYSNFGSVDQPYFFYRFNHLPSVLRWLKNRRS